MHKIYFRRKANNLPNPINQFDKRDSFLQNLEGSGRLDFVKLDSRVRPPEVQLIIQIEPGSSILSV